MAIDEAMRLGYNWKWGPFELIDRIGAGKLIARLKQEGEAIPELLARAEATPFYRVTEAGGSISARMAPITTSSGRKACCCWRTSSSPASRCCATVRQSLWDIGDGVLCLEFTSKSNSLDEGIITLLAKATKLVKEKYKALVIYNEGSNFSVGANLGLALFACNIAAFGEVEKLIAQGQKVYQDLKYAPFPTVAAPAGMALAAAASCCSIPAPCRPTRKAISGSWNAASASFPAGAAARKC